MINRPLYNIYCDESCHLENDGIPVMVLGALWLPIQKKKEIFDRLKEIRSKHGLPPHFEIKWNKVSPAKSVFYKDIIDYFFDDDDLRYRALIVPNKDLLDHKRFDQDHNDFYYKMYFDLLKVILEPDSSYNIYLDIKDTICKEKVKKLQEILQHNHYDYSRQIVRKIQEVQSHEAIPLQLTDLLTGAIGYRNRNLESNEGKLALINRIIERSGYQLRKTTLLREKKINLFFWTADFNEQ